VGCVGGGGVGGGRGGEGWGGGWGVGGVAGIVLSLRDAKQTGWPGVGVRGREGGREREERGTMHVCERVCA